MNRRIGRKNRSVVGSGDRDGDSLRYRDAVIVLDRDRIGLRDRLALGQRLQRRIVIVQREVPADRSLVVGVRQVFRHWIDGEVADLSARNEVRQPGRRRRQRNGRRMCIGQIEILERDRAVGCDIA